MAEETRTAIGRRVILKDLQGNYLLPYTDTGGNGNPDGKTIIESDKKELVVTGELTKDGQYNYDWIGTREAYEAAIDAGEIQSDWTCYIIDDNNAPDIMDITRLSKACSPFTLLEGKYFEKLTFNPCWLISDGLKKDGKVYKDSYSALINELSGQYQPGQVTPTGYVVRGLSVKDSTATDITEYDFVVYQSEEKFKLPTKIKLASGSGVVGNGMTLGLNDGTNNCGLRNINNYCTGLKSIYGTSIGTSALGTSDVVNNVSVGVTTDGTKSGIETDTTGLYLYFYVGDAITDLQTINGGAVLHALDKKLERFDCDGQWVAKTATLSTATAVGTYTIDLSDYLPDDNYNYELLVRSYANSHDSNHSTIEWRSDLVSYSFRTNIVSQYDYYSENFFTIPVKRYIYITIGTTNISEALLAQSYAYRRIGTNN